MTARVMVAVAAMLLAGTTAGAQRWRTLDASRQLTDSAPIAVRLEYGAGKLEVKPAGGAMLYQMHVHYDAERDEPVARLDEASHSLVLGLRSRGMHVSGSSDDGGSMHAELSDRLPMELTVEAGAVEGDLQLGGLRLRQLDVRSGASDITLRFDRPNPERMRSMTLEVGAAGMKIVNAGNAGAERMQVSVGVGGLNVDLGGQWTRDMEISANVGLGGLTIHLPADAGVSVDASTFLTSFDKAGLEKRDDGWYSPGFEKAPRHVRIRLRAFLGGLTLERDSH